MVARTKKKSKNDEAMRIRMPAEIKKKFFDLCEELDIKPSRRLRQLIRLDLNGLINERH